MFFGLLREDTHKKSGFLSGRTTKGVLRVNPPDHFGKKHFFLKSGCFSPKIGGKWTTIKPTFILCVFPKVTGSLATQCTLTSAPLGYRNCQVVCELSFLPLVQIRFHS